MTQAPLFNAWGTPAERERRRRIRLALYAYAYEIANAPMVDDAMYDALALTSVPTIQTGNIPLDTFWRECFTPDSGQWIHSHPDLSGIAVLHRKLT